MNGGQSKPPSLACPDESGNIFDVVTKLAEPAPSGISVGPLSLALELIGAIAARHLGLAVPGYAIVEVNREFANSVPGNMKRLFNNNLGLHFGSAYLQQFIEFQAGTPVSVETDLQLLKDIMAFDAMVLNSDRRKHNPNLLESGDDYILIDHSTILTVHVPPHVDDYMTDQQLRDHVLFKNLTGNHRRYETHISQWNSKMTTAEIDQLFSFVPMEWTVQSASYRLIVDFMRTRYTQGAVVKSRLKQVIK